MPEGQNRLDDLAVGLTRAMISLRWIVLPVSIAIAVFIGSFASQLEFSNNYRAFFSKENPELKAFEVYQATFSKNDNVLFLFDAGEGKSVFTNEMLAAIDYATEQAWLIPYASRVDSVTNYQHTYAIDDDLIVENLIDDPMSLSAEELAQKRDIVLNEPILRGLLVSDDGRATGMNVVMQFPEKELNEVPDAAAAARALREDVMTKYPNVKIYLTGGAMLNNAFSEAVQSDLRTLIPLMFIVVLAMTAVAIRSASATGATLVIIVLSTMVAMGFAGLTGVKFTGPSPMASVIILTLAVADSIHILISMRKAMQQGLDKRAAIIEAIRINFLPVAVTSITTIIGFLALNLSDAPPFRDLGTITAVGIFAAWVFSITMLPALLALAPIRVKPRSDGVQNGAMVAFANMVIRRWRILFIVLGVSVVALMSFIPTMVFSDEFRQYFDRRIEFRRDTDKSVEFFGFYPIELSISSGEAGGISDPEFLATLEELTQWLRDYPNMTHVYSIVDIMKRLNKNLNGDDPAFYRLPEGRDLSAQYLLLYEMSLPYGLDLNDRIDIDKSKTRMTATLGGETSTVETREFLREIKDWFAQNAPQYELIATGPPVMFTFIAERNLNSMILGTSVAIVAIAFIMMGALRSIGMGLVSLAPNALPILAGYGVWALLVGEVGFSVAMIASISLGIVIDDTVHFLTKFVRARREKGLSTADSVRYAFETVGVAIIVNTIVLGAGFLVMTMSAFQVNMQLGMLTSITIGFALVLDFLFLPALLLLIARCSGESIDVKGDNYVRVSAASAA